MGLELDGQEVFDFRLEQYLRMGFATDQAASLASRDDVDWHYVENVLAQCHAADCPKPYRVTFLICT